MDLRIIQLIFCFLSPNGKLKNVNSIVEPYAMHKKSLYGYSIFAVFLVIAPHSANIEEPDLLDHQGNDPSTR